MGTSMVLLVSASCRTAPAMELSAMRRCFRTTFWHAPSERISPVSTLCACEAALQYYAVHPF